jgi:hypothetical protein
MLSRYMTLHVAGTKTIYMAVIAERNANLTALYIRH